MKNRRIIAISLILAWVGLCNVLGQQTYSLEQCRSMAIDNNNALKIAAEEKKVAEHTRKAASRQFLPSFSANTTYLWNQKNISLFNEDKFLPVVGRNADGSINITAQHMANTFVDMGGGNYVPLDANGQPFNPATNPEKIQFKDYAYLPKDELEFDVHNIFIGTVGFTQPIFMGGKIREMYRMTKYMENIANKKYESEAAEVLYDVDVAYWQVVSVYNKLQLAKDYHNLLVRLDTNMQLLIEEGMATKAEGLQVKVKLNETEMALTKAQDGYKLANMLLCQICGLPLNSDIHLEDEDNEITAVTYSTHGTAEEHANNRSEVYSLEQALNIAESTKRLAVSRFLPTLALTGNYMVSNPNLFNGVSKTFDGQFMIGAVLHVPIFHFGEKIQTLKAAQAQQRIAQYQLQEAKEKITLQITQAEFHINEANHNWVMASRNLEKAEENLRYANLGFEEGVIPVADVMAAQTAWISAYSEKIDAGINARLNKLYWDKAIGELKVNNNQ